MGIGMLIFAFFGVTESILNLSMNGFGSLFGVFYISWGIGQFFEGNKLKNTFKGLFSYFLGLFTFAVLTLTGGFLSDKII